MSVCHAPPCRAYGEGCGLNGAVSGTPTEHQEIRATKPVWVVELDGGNVVCDAGYLLGAQADHQLVVYGVVRDIAAAVGLFEAADAVHQARGPRERPRPR